MTIADLTDFLRGYGITITRRTLQYYASPQLRIIPKPLGGGRGGTELPVDSAYKILLAVKLKQQYRLELKEIKGLIDSQFQMIDAYNKPLLFRLVQGLVHPRTVVALAKPPSSPS